MKDKTGFLLFIHPASWISLQHSRSDLILSKQVVYLRFYNYAASQHLFVESGKLPLTYYLLQNISTKNDTNIYDNCLKRDIKYNIYENNFVPTEAIPMFEKIFKLRNKFGNLQDKYYNTKRPNKDLISKKYNSSHKFPLISITNKEIDLEFYNSNLSRSNEKKLIFPNFSMGYPIFDDYGILYPSSNMMHCVIYENNPKKLKQIQSLFYTNLVFYIINLLKTKQNFFNNKIFEIVPDITKITNKSEISDNYLFDLLKLSQEDIRCIEIYSKSGEGRLSKEQIHQFTSFNIRKFIPNFKITDFPTIDKNNLVEKLQSVVRGHQQRNKTKKIKKAIIKVQSVTRGHQQRKKNKSVKKGGAKKLNTKKS